MFLPKQYRLSAFALWLCVCGPIIALYLPLWLLGVATYECYAMSYWKPRKYVSLLLFSGTIISYFCFRHYVGNSVTGMYLPYGVYQEIINFLYFMIIGMMLCFNIIFFDQIAGSAPFWNPILEKWIRWSAGASFTLYLIHEPIFALICSLFSSVQTSVPMAVGAWVITLVVVFLMAELGERRKKLFVHAFWWLGNLLKIKRGRFAP